jgi:hypothetical protein
LQNQNLYGVADTLSDTERRRERGAFFGSIHATLNHLLWADRIWMYRLAGTPRPDGGIPESVSIIGLFGARPMRSARRKEGNLAYASSGGGPPPSECHAAIATLAFSTMAAKAAGSWIARSDSTLRSTRRPALASPSMNRL